MQSKASKLAVATLDAQYSVALLAMGEGVSRTDALSALQATWAYDRGELGLAKAAPTDGKPGDHGIPAIGTQERAFYDALNADQKKAYEVARERIYSMAGKKWVDYDPYALDAPVDDWKRSALTLLVPETMRTYLVGQMLAGDLLGTRRAGPLGEQDKRALDFLSDYAFNEISSKFDALKTDLRRNLMQGVYQGLNPDEVARNVRNQLNDHKTAWESVAITETSRAESQGRLQEFLDEGYDQVVGSSAHDVRTCDHCLRLIDGKVQAISDIMGVSNYGRKQADYEPVIPLHPRCRCVWLPYGAIQRNAA